MNVSVRVLNLELSRRLNDIGFLKQQVLSLEDRTEECRKDIERSLELVEELRAAIKSLGGVEDAPTKLEAA